MGGSLLRRCEAEIGVHAMKGAAQNLCCGDIGEICVRLEHRSRLANFDDDQDILEVRALVQELSEASRRLAVYLSAGS